MTKIVKIIKENLFAEAIILAYALIFILRPEIGMVALSNSGYYIK